MLLAIKVSILIVFADDDVMKVLYQLTKFHFYFFWILFEIFLRVIFFAKLRGCSFVKIKSLRNAEITLSFTDVITNHILVMRLPISDVPANEIGLYCKVAYLFPIYKV